MTASPLLFRWRDALFASDLTSTTRLVLLTLSCHGDTDGADIRPGTRTLARKTGLSRRAVMDHLQAAERSGWIRRRELGRDRGQGWKRHGYELVIPAKVVNEGDHEGGERESPPSPERGEPHAQGGEPDDTKVVNEGDHTSSVDLSKTSPPPEGESADADPDRMGADELVAKWIEALGSRPAGVGKQGAVAKRLTEAHDRPTVLRAIDGIQQLYPHSDGEPWDLFDLEKKFTKATTARRNGRRGGTTRQAELDEEDLAAWNPISGDKKKRRRGRPNAR